MKRIFLFYIMAIMAISMSAQNDVTTFLGIPVDGFKSEMKQKLVSKGFLRHHQIFESFFVLK